MKDSNPASRLRYTAGTAMHRALTFKRRGEGEGGSPQGLVRNLLMQFFSLDSSKLEVCGNLFFFYIVIT